MYKSHVFQSTLMVAASYTFCRLLLVGDCTQLKEVPVKPFPILTMCKPEECAA